ncbi:MAG: helix-turn-helix domain-containing protein [Candidatus Dormibacteria bacterium]
MGNANRLDLGARIIRFAREQAGLSQGKLAQASGISQGLISRYEAGEVAPSLRTIQRLLNAAGVVMTIDVAGVRMIDTTRMPTVEESEGIELAYVRMLERLPADQQPGIEAAKGRWGSSLRKTRRSGRLAFPQYVRDPSGS